MVCDDTNQSKHGANYHCCTWEYHDIRSRNYTINTVRTKQIASGHGDTLYGIFYLYYAVSGQFLNW